MSSKPLCLAVVSNLLLVSCWPLDRPSDATLTPLPADRCARATPLLGLLIVLSRPGNQDLRMLARETYPASEIEKLGFRRVFVLENDPNRMHRFELQLAQENDWYSDIITLNYTESPHNLALRSSAASKWALENCSRARFIIRADDETFIDLYSLAKHLEQVDNDDYLRGHVYNNFLIGNFFYTSPKTLRWIVEKAKDKFFINQKSDEDIFTGVLADLAGAERVDVPTIRPRKSYGCCCYGNNVDKLFTCQWIAFHIPLENRNNWGSLVVEATAAKRIKDHGKFCFFLGCEKFKLADLWRRDLTCFGFKEQGVDGKC